MAASTPSGNNLNLFVKEVLSNGKAKYLKDLGIGSPKYVESSRMFDNLLKIAGGLPYQTDRYVIDICHSSVKYLQNICTKVSVTYLQHIGIWPHNISATDI
jgi:hypothetical protein